MNYIATDEHIHQLCQTIAKVNRSFVPKRDDDSHTNMYFDELSQRITGHWIETPKGRRIFSLNLKDYCFEWQNSSKDVIASYSIEGKTIVEWESQMAQGLEYMGLEMDNFLDPLHFEITEYAFRDSAFYKPSAAAIEEWMRLRTLGNEACMQLTGYAQVESSIRIWPHHFDTGVYFDVDNRIGIGFGLAMKDEGTDAPYFYLSGYPGKGSISYTNLPEIGAGHWLTGEGFNGAILRADRPLDELRRNIPDYVTLAFKWFVKQVYDD